MKKSILLFFLFALSAQVIVAQPDIATVETKSRFERSKSVYLAGGVGIVQGALGDYSNGLSFETGFNKRLNKLMSIGGGFQYMDFKYDASKTYPYYYNPTVDEAIELTLSGGDVMLLSAGFNLKINFIPVSDNSVVSIYGIATPFVSLYSRGEVSGNGDFYYQNLSTGVYDQYDFSDPWTAEGFPILAAESKVTGGAYLGVGLEFFPAKKFSGFAQATYGYTLPITFVSTSSYLHDEDQYTDVNGRIYYGDDLSMRISYYNDEFPIVKKGFTALSIKLGIAFNF